MQGALLVQASDAICGSNLKLRPSASPLNLDMNNFLVTGAVKAVAFSKGSNKCALSFTSYDFNTRTNNFSGQIIQQGDIQTPNATYGFSVALQNSDASTCLINGSAWQALSSAPTNGNSIQIVFKNLSDASVNQPMAISGDKLMKMSGLNSALGLIAYTCQ